MPHADKHTTRHLHSDYYETSHDGHQHIILTVVVQAASACGLTGVANAGDLGAQLQLVLTA